MTAPNLPQKRYWFLRRLLSRIIVPLIHAAEGPEQYVDLLKEWAGPLGLTQDPERFRALLFTPETGEPVALRKYGYSLEQLSSDPKYREIIQPLLTASPTSADSFAKSSQLQNCEVPIKTPFFSKLRSLFGKKPK